MREIPRRFDPVTLACAVALGLGIRAWFGVPSSGGIVGALRVLDGDAPYRDFWTMYAPGQFYVLAGLFATFGEKLIVASAAGTVFAAGATGVLVALSHAIGLSRVSALVAGGLFGMVLFATEPALNTYQPALCFMLAGWLTWLRRGPEARLTGTLGAGAWIGVAAWFKHDVAAYAALALALADVGSRMMSGKRPAMALIAGSVRILVGAAALGLPVVAACWAVAGSNAWVDLIRFPATDFPLSRAESYPGLLPPFSSMTDLRTLVEGFSTWLRFTIPAAMWAAGLVALALHGVGWPAPERRGVLLLGAAYPFFWLAAHVQINTHIWTMSAIGLLLGGLGWTAASRLRSGRFRRAAAAALFVYAGSLLVPPGTAAARIVRDWPTSRTSAVPSLRGLRIPAEELRYYEPLAAFVDRNVAAGECIYVGLRRHDVLITSNPMVYAVVGRRGCTPFDELHPAVADRPEAQAAIVEALERRGARLAILWEFGRTEAFFNRIREARRLTLPGTGEELLDRYIETQFPLVEKHGEYQVRWRGPAPR